MTPSKTELELEEEQTYFDHAKVQRDRSLDVFDRAPQNAVHEQAAADLRREAVKRRTSMDPDQAVAFGKFVTEKGECQYIGYGKISDESSDLLVINWQAPAAGLFYQATATVPQGVRSTRKFSTTKNRIDSFDDVLFIDLARRVEKLTQNELDGIDDAILNDLNRDRSGEMQDIVQTISASQDDLVRSSLKQLLVIQGGPGTGKTAVALHRLSWLLFNHSDELPPERVLVVGPNPTFNQYIRNVLPGLGDRDVVHLDLMRLGPVRSDHRQEPREVASLKGQARMADLLSRGLKMRVRTLDEADSLEVISDSGPIRVPAREVNTQLAVSSKMYSYNQGRLELRLWLTNRLSQRQITRTVPTTTQIDQAVERLWPSLAPHQFLRELLGSRDRLLAAAGAQFTAADVGLLYRKAAERVSAELWSDSDVALLDEAQDLISGGELSYRYIVVDEAQDLTPMQLRSIRRRSVDGSMTLVGDIAQSTGPAARNSWDEVVQGLVAAAPANIRELEISYRVPRQIMEFASRLLPICAPGITAPRVIREVAGEPGLYEVEAGEYGHRAVELAKEFASRGLFVGIVCPEGLIPDLANELKRSKVKWSDGRDGSLGQAGVNVVTPVGSKGLEFDAVVVVNPSGIINSGDDGARLLYIALTRATRHLAVVHDGDPLPIASDPSRPDATERQEVPPRLAAATGRGDQVQAATNPPHTPSEASRKPSGGALADRIKDAAAAELAQQLRESVPPALWPEVLDAVRRKLAVSDEDMFDQLD